MESIRDLLGLSNRTDYVYTPLPDDNDTIRLLYIKSSLLATGKIRGELRTAKLSDSPRYAALSYTWGRLEFNHTAVIDGHGFAITESLHEALAEFRVCASGQRDLPIWVDQMSINQEDIPEKNHQVRMMRTIYENADTVYIGLTAPFQFFQPLLKLCDIEARLFALRGYSDPSVLVDFGQELNWGRFDGLMGSWFVRVWIFQEAVVCQRTKLMYSGTVIDFDLFLLMARLRREVVPQKLDMRGFFFPPLGITDTANAYNNAAMIYLARRYLSENKERYRMLELLRHSRGMMASDPRDKVYALMGLAKDGSIFPDPDYSKSVEEIYVETVESIIRKSDHFHLQHILSSTGRHYQHRESLPSWVPEWDFWSENDLIVGINHGKLAHDPHDSKNEENHALNTGCCELVQVSGQHSHLKVFGHIIGTITILSEMVPSVHNFEKIQETFLDWACTWESFLAAELYSDTGAAITTSSAVDAEDTISQLVKERIATVLNADQFSVKSKKGRGHSQGEDQDPRTRAFQGYRRLLWYAEGNKPPQYEDPSRYGHKDKLFSDYQSSMQLASHRRSLCVTSNKKKLGLVPCIAEIGDRIALIYGCVAPFVLRESKDPEKPGWCLIGECYVEDYSLSQKEAEESWEEILLR